MPTTVTAPRARAHRQGYRRADGDESRADRDESDDARQSRAGSPPRVTRAAGVSAPPPAQPCTRRSGTHRPAGLPLAMNVRRPLGFVDFVSFGVSDASNTAPHLRRARAFDEGGRGLLLVAQLTQGWGTRHTTDGKTIWCAQTLPEPEPR